MKGRVTKTGYLDNSPDRFNDYNVILGENITMEGVSNPIVMFPIKNNKVGNPVQGVPGENYYFPGADGVLEMPIPSGTMSYQRMAKGGSSDAKMREVLSNVAYGKGGNTMTPELAAKILKTGSIYGKTLTASQKSKFAELAATIGIDENGDPIEEEEENRSEDVAGYKKGGVPKSKKKHSKTTSKNIFTAINEIFARNTNLYGSGGKEFYKPELKDGGWLDQYQIKGEVEPKTRTVVHTDKTLFDKAYKAEKDSLRAYNLTSRDKYADKVNYMRMNLNSPNMSKEDIAGFTNLYKETDDYYKNINEPYRVVTVTKTKNNLKNDTGNLLEQYLKNTKLKPEEYKVIKDKQLYGQTYYSYDPKTLKVTNPVHKYENKITPAKFLAKEFPKITDKDVQNLYNRTLNDGSEPLYYTGKLTPNQEQIKGSRTPKTGYFPAAGVVEKVGTHISVIPYWKKPVIHNIYEPPVELPKDTIKPVIKDTIKPISVPIKSSQNITRQWNFAGTNPVLEYRDASGKIIKTETYNNAGYNRKLIEPIIIENQSSKKAEEKVASKKYGGWLDQYPEGGENPPGTSDKPIASKKGAYQEAIKNNYQKYLDSIKYSTPYTDITKEGMNCIHGVCQVIKGTGAKNFMQDYTGNQTFKDARKKEGYYEADPVNEGFEIGDIIQYAYNKDNMQGDNRFIGKVTPINAKELVPAHAKVILDKYVDEDGITRYKIGHNQGKDKFIFSKDDDHGDIREETLLKHYTEGFHGYDGVIVNRYDPEYVKQKEKEESDEIKKIKGENPYASLYKGTTKIKALEHPVSEARELLDLYKKNYQKLGKTADMPPNVLDQIFHNEVGIYGQESEFGKEGVLKSLVPDALVPIGRKIQESFRSSDDWITDYWNKNADNVKSKFKTKEQFAESIRSKNKLSPEAREYLRYEGPRSKGGFQQKELSKRGRILGANLDDKENQFLSSMYLAIDNYHLLKKKYPELSDNELVDLTTLMHNAPSKALTPEYVNYYLKNNDIDYINKVKRQRGDIVVEQKPSYVEKLKKDTVNKVSPQEVDAIKKFLRGQVTKKKQGGWLEEYEEGGEKPWGEMTPKERAAYLDAKEKKKPVTKAEATVLAKQAEAKSRAQAKKEYYEDYVREGTKKALTHPLFQAPGMAYAATIAPVAGLIASAPGLYESGKNIVKGEGDWSDYANIGLTALGIKGVAPNIKNTYKASAKAISKPVIKKAVVNKKYVLPSKEKIKDLHGFIPRRQFVKEMQKEGLIGKDFKDLNYAASSTDKTNALTKLALDRYHGGFRLTSGKLPPGGKGRQKYTGNFYDMSRPAYGQKISEFENMTNAGVDFSDPKSIAEYQATHIPMEDYGYRSTNEGATHKYGFIFNKESPYLRPDPEYGTYQFKRIPKTNYDQGNYLDWYNNFYKNQEYHGVSGRPRSESIADYVVVPWRQDNAATLVGPRGRKAYEIDKSFPFTDMTNLTSSQKEELKKYVEDYQKKYLTGWRGDYKTGGWLEDFK